VPVTSVSAVVDDKPAYTPRNEVEARVWDGCEWRNDSTKTPLIIVLAPWRARRKRWNGRLANTNKIRRRSR
jgi:hypothetical protein